MTIGLILLAIAAIFMFFGVTEKFFRKIGLPNWVAFLIVLSLVMGAVVPQINIFGIQINLGGFLVPLAVMIVMICLCPMGGDRLKSLLAIVAVASVSVAVQMLIFPVSAGLKVTISVIIGFVGGGVAYIIAQSRLATLAGVTGGMVLGDIIANLIFRFVIDGSAIALGLKGVFDAIIIGVIFSMVFAEAISAMKKSAHSKDVAVPLAGDNELIMLESAEDINLADKEEKKKVLYHFNEEDFEDYFSDDID